MSDYRQVGISSHLDAGWFILIRCAYLRSNLFRFDRLESSPPTRPPGTDVLMSLSDSVTEMEITAESIRLEQTTFPKSSLESSLESPLELAMPDGHVTENNRKGRDSPTSLETYSTFTQRLGPATLLECSPNFIPETYTMERDSLIF